MKIYILGGFLGSGKTTLLMKVADWFMDKGEKVSILVNEAGSIGVDGTTMKNDGYNSVELPSGCICCSMVAGLREALVGIKRDYDPDVLLIEPTGLAFSGKVRETIELINYPAEVIQIIGVFDGPRFRLFTARKREFYTKQLQDSDILVMNKMDLTSEEIKKEAIEWMAREVPGVPVIPVVGTTGENLDKVFEELKQ